MAATPRLKYLTTVIRRAHICVEEAATPTLVLICVIDQPYILNALDYEGHVGRS
jgi:hypothetical protein